MKSRFTAFGFFLLAVIGVSPILASSATKSASTESRDAKLSDLKQQHAVNEGEIKQVRARIKADADRKAAQATKEKAKSGKDSISEMSSADVEQLQRLMEKKARLEQLISDTLKAGSNDSDTLKPASKI